MPLHVLWMSLQGGDKYRFSLGGFPWVVFFWLPFDVPMVFLCFPLWLFCFPFGFPVNFLWFSYGVPLVPFL